MPREEITINTNFIEGFVLWRQDSTQANLVFLLEETMNFIICLIVGGVIGWIASMIMRTDAQQGMLLNVVVGIVGSFLGGFLVGPLLGAGTINQNDFSIMGLLASLIGAVILLAIVNLVLRGRVR